MTLADKHKLRIDYNMFTPKSRSWSGYGEYDISIDATEPHMCFGSGELPAININTSYLEHIDTAKDFWEYAYGVLKDELKYYEKCAPELEKQWLG